MSASLWKGRESNGFQSLRVGVDDGVDWGKNEAGSASAFWSRSRVRDRSPELDPEWWS